MYYQTYYQSPLGNLLLVCDEEGLIGLWIEGQKYFLGNIKENIIKKDNHPILIQTQKWLDDYFHQRQPSINDLKLTPKGTQFQQMVWKILCEIPYGQTMTYGEIAKKVAKALNKKTMSAQAVGGAVGHNPISIIIPCHRVVGKDGSLTGYAGGIDNKIKLLQLENVDMTRLYELARDKEYISMYILFVGIYKRGLFPGKYVDIR